LSSVANNSGKHIEIESGIVREYINVVLFCIGRKEPDYNDQLLVEPGLLIVCVLYLICLVCLLCAANKDVEEPCIIWSTYGRYLASTIERFTAAMRAVAIITVATVCFQATVW